MSHVFTFHSYPATYMAQGKNQISYGRQLGFCKQNTFEDIKLSKTTINDDYLMLFSSSLLSYFCPETKIRILIGCKYYPVKLSRVYTPPPPQHPNMGNNWNLMRVCDMKQSYRDNNWLVRIKREMFPPSSYWRLKTKPKIGASRKWFMKGS